MKPHSESNLSGPERRRLRLARENACLDARRPDSRRVAQAYGLWCWRLRIPMVWFERRTPHSRYGRVRLDMLTTPNLLTADGQAEMRGLGAAASAEETAIVSPHDACWERIPLARLEEVAKAVFRAAVKSGNYRPNRSKLLDIAAGKPPKLVRAAPRSRASGDR